MKNGSPLKGWLTLLTLLYIIFSYIPSNSQVLGEKKQNIKWIEINQYEYENCQIAIETCPLIDRTLALNIDSISQIYHCSMVKKKLTWEQDKNPSSRFFYDRKDQRQNYIAIWRFLPLRNISERSMTFFLTFSYEPQFYIEFPDRVFKKIKHKNSWLQYKFIESMYFDSGSFFSKHSLQFDLLPKQEIKIWICDIVPEKNSKELIQKPIALEKTENALKRTFGRKMLDNFISGASFILLLNSIIVFFILKRKEYLYFFFYLFCMLLFSSRSDFSQFLLLPLNFISPNYVLWLSGVGVFNYILFVKAFVGAENFKRRILNLGIQGIAISCLLGVAIGFFEKITELSQSLKANEHIGYFFRISDLIIEIIVSSFCIFFFVYILIVTFKLFKKNVPNTGVILSGNIFIIATLFILLINGTFEFYDNNLDSLVFSSGFFLEGVLFTGGITRKMRRLQLEKEEEQKLSISRLETKVKERTSELESQRNILKEKNREILDSIEYAKRIQTAILPPPRIVKSFLKNSFILYLPKDIVAGDFYWMESIDESVYFAACDCTGHGVPGAMVSVVCNNALNRALHEFGERMPGNIFDKTRQLVMENFAKSDEEVNDGMDASLCVLDINTRKLRWSGANNPIWIYRASEKRMQEIKPDKQAIGRGYEFAPFTTHELELEKGDIIYIFTDGYADQFGGVKGKKLTKAKFREYMLHIAELPMETQREKLLAQHDEWRGKLEQVDDICVIGVRV